MPSSRIAVDAFGGDACPDVEVESAVVSARRGTPIVLVGEGDILRERLRRFGRTDDLPLLVEHAPEVIGNDETPSRAVRTKAGASMPVAFDAVRDGRAHAVVSAGHSGMMLACGLFKYGRITGVDRPAIVTTLPTQRGQVCMLDMGANVECRPLNLCQFAIMGATYATLEHGKPRPRVGILANGREEGKGTENTRQAHALLASRRSPRFEFAGYVEGRDVFEGDIDVVVTDGFTGNVALKMVEGAARLFGGHLERALSRAGLRSRLGARLLHPVLREIGRVFDPEAYGGAPLLGVSGVAIICHGGASVRAMTAAIELAARFVARELAPALAHAVAEHREFFELRGGRSDGAADRDEEEAAP